MFTDMSNPGPVGHEEPTNRHEWLVRGLVGDDPERQRLYMTNAYFFNSINNLAVMLVPMMDGLATGAAEAAEQDASMLEAMRSSMAEGMGDDRPVNAEGHQWPCPRFYRTATSSDVCNCGGDHKPTLDEGAGDG